MEKHLLKIAGDIVVQVLDKIDKLNDSRFDERVLTYGQMYRGGKLWQWKQYGGMPSMPILDIWLTFFKIYGIIRSRNFMDIDDSESLGGLTRMYGVKQNEKQTIMILEDDEDLAEGISMSLNSTDLEFVHCRTVVDAKNLLQQKLFDLLIFDINLPDGSGLELCREVRRSSQIPIALLTAKDMEMDIVKGLECGADDYITKPFSLMVLRARLRALLRRNGGEQKAEYSDEVFRFSFDTMKFYKKGSFLELSKTEQRILYLLVFNAGQVLTRERLLEWVWPEGTEYVEDNALSVGIRRLRDKLEDVPSKPVYIKTVYGKGYTWEKF